MDKFESACLRRQTCACGEHAQSRATLRCAALLLFSAVFTVHSVCAVECGTECVRAARSQCPRPCVFFGQGKIECMFAESSLTPFPKGANMHSPCPTCFSSLGLHVWVPRLLLSPLVLLTFLTALWASVRLRTPLGLATLWVEKRPFGAASLFEPAAAGRPVTLVVQHCPLCQVGCSTCEPLARLGGATGSLVGLESLTLE